MAFIMREMCAVAAAAAGAASDFANELSALRLEDTPEDRIGKCLISLLKSTLQTGGYDVDAYVVAKTKSGIVVQSKQDYDAHLHTGLYINEKRVKVSDPDEIPRIKSVICRFLFGQNLPEKEYTAAEVKGKLENLLSDASTTTRPICERTYFERQLLGKDFDVESGGGNSMPAPRMLWTNRTVHSELPFTRLISLANSLDEEQRRVVGFILNRLHTKLEGRDVFWNPAMYTDICGPVAQGRWKVSTTDEANVAISKLLALATFIQGY